jgi:hypothetical protein
VKYPPPLSRGRVNVCDPPGNRPSLVIRRRQLMRFLFATAKGTPLKRMSGEFSLRSLRHASWFT